MATEFKHYRQVKKVKLESGKGYHLLNAQRKAKTSEEITFALIAELAEIDGQSIVYEDLLEFDLEDVLALQAENLGEVQIIGSDCIIHLAKNNRLAVQRNKNMDSLMNSLFG